MVTQHLDDMELRRAWSSGHPLSFAWVAFSGEEVQEELEAMRTGIAPDHQLRAERAKADLLRRLRTGELHAAGVVATHIMGGEVLAPVIPSICREGPVNWSSDAISEGPHSFRKVRVYPNGVPIERAKATGAAGEKAVCTEVLVHYVISRPGWDGAMNKLVYESLNALLLEEKKSGQSNKLFVDERTWRNRRKDARKKLEILGKTVPARWLT